MWPGECPGVGTSRTSPALVSATLAGTVIVGMGYSAAFLLMGGIAAIGFLGYLLAMPETGKAAGTRGAASPKGMAPAE